MNSSTAAVPQIVSPYQTMSWRSETLPKPSRIEALAIFEKTTQFTDSTGSELPQFLLALSRLTPKVFLLRVFLSEPVAFNKKQESRTRRSKDGMLKNGPQSGT